MLKHSGKRASALLLSLAVAAAAFAVPAFATDALPMASQPETVSAPVEPLPQDPSSAVQSQPETVSQPEVLPSEPEGTVSGGIEPTPDDLFLRHGKEPPPAWKAPVPVNRFPSRKRRPVRYSSSP